MNYETLSWSLRLRMQENVTVSEKEYFDDMFISDDYKTIETKMQNKSRRKM